MAVKKEVSTETIEKAKKKLGGLHEKQPPAKLLDDALEELRPVIEEAVRKNYSREEIVDLLNESGFAVKIYTIKKFLNKKQAAIKGVEDDQQ